MLRRKSSCFGLAILLLCGTWGNAFGQDLDLLSDDNSTVIPPDTLPTTLPTTLPSSTPTTISTTLPTTTVTPEPTPTVSTTTPSQETTTTATPTSTASPTKAPDQGPSTWSVYDPTTNTTCIVLKLQAVLFVPYVNTSQQVVIANIPVPNDAAASGSCSELLSATQSITLSWVSMAPAMLPNHTLTLGFAKNNSEGSDFVFSLTSVAVLLQPDPVYFPNASTVDSITAHNLTLNSHPTRANNSYRCNAAETVDLSSNLTVPQPVQITLSNMQVEAFRSRADNEFSRAVDCPADAVLNSDIVPIAVGCALAALVVIVLVAYLIGRRRARQRGYQSV